MVDINKIIRKLLIKSPPFGIILENVNIIEISDVETAATNGHDIYYNKEFIGSLPLEEQVFIFAHEISHICLDHIYRSEGKNQDVWNKATDAVINPRLIKNGYKMPEDVIIIPGADEHDAESLYQKLMEENKKQNKNTDKSKNKGSHELWKEAIEKRKNSRNQSENQVLKEATKEFSQMGEDEFFDYCQKEKQKKLEDLRKELARNSIPSHQQKDICFNNIGTQKQIINWKRLLIEYSNSDYAWSYQNIFIEDGILKPTLEEIKQSEVEILLDTSGSISETLLKNFLRECKNIFSNSKIKVGCFDTEFYGFQEIRSIKDIDGFKIVGRGGTNFEAAVNAFSKDADNKIIFTDGDASMPKKSMNITWLVFGGQTINPLGGKVINIDDNQLTDLYFIENDNETFKRKTK